jgi:hypothetical protein
MERLKSKDEGCLVLFGKRDREWLQLPCTGKNRAVAVSHAPTTWMCPSYVLDACVVKWKMVQPARICVLGQSYREIICK